MENILEADIRDFFFKGAESYGFIKVQKELSIDGLRIDIFAIDKDHNPYVIEFKKEKARHIVGQGAMYLALAPSYRNEICKKIEFYDINWNNLKVILIAPDFFDRDLTAGKYDPLKGRIHFYSFNIVLNRNKDIFGLSMAYLGPDEVGPMLLPVITDKYDFVDLYKRLFELENKESRHDYYTNYFIPLFEKIKEKLDPYFNEHGLYYHTSYFNGVPPYFMVRYGTHKKKSHRASIIFGLYSETIVFGFDLTHSLEEGKKLSEYFHDKSKCQTIAKELLSCEDHYLWIPFSGIRSSISIEDLEEKALVMLLKSYNPIKVKDSYLHIITDYEYEHIFVEDAIDTMIGEHKKFKFLFDILQGK